jgi:cysteine synthase
MSSDPLTQPVATQEPSPPLVAHPLVFGSVLDLVGNTPLVKIPGDLGSKRLSLRKQGRAAPPVARSAQIWGKLENLNPAGSVKDRIALAMIQAAERDGKLKPGGLVIEPTSGNTGIGLALVCARRGYRCVLTMPASMSLERRALLEALGAELILTEDQAQMEGAIAKAEQLEREHPGAFMPRQFDNPENPEIHYRTTGEEILAAFEDQPLNAFVVGVGTGGTVSGAGRLLRERRPECQIIAVEAESCATISRGERGPTKIQGWGAGFVPRNYSPEIPHQVLTVSDEDAYRTKRQLAEQAGLLLGISAGGAVHVALQVAQALPPSANVVVILPDTGERYFSLDEYFPNGRG